jgi:DNA adenine methylase
MSEAATDTRLAQRSVAPLLRWAGSKRKLLPELVKYVPDRFGRYIEPFTGSACLFFALRPDRAILSDLNQELIDTYRILRSHPKLVHRSVSSMPKTKRYYYELRDTAPLKLNDLEKAARFVYLNRNCFNGVYRTNRAGRFNVPRGKRAGELPTESQFVRCANALRKAQLVDGDFERATAQARKGDFVYLDPPYTKRGSRHRGEYGYSSFDTADLDRLSRCLRDLDRKGAIFLLSYAYCREIREIARGWQSRAILVRRHVAGFQRHRAIVRELLISNRDLKSWRTPR